jgi:hypothetical protein
MIELEAPLETEQQPSRAALHVVRPETEEAVHLLDADYLGGAVVDEKINIVLRQNVDDDGVNDFHGVADQMCEAFIDDDNSVYIQVAPKGDSDGRVYLETDEFEIVEQGQGAAQVVATDATEAICNLLDAAAVEIAEADPAPGLTAAVGQPVVASDPPRSWPATPIVLHAEADRKRRDYLRQKDILQEQISALMIEGVKLKEQAKRCKKEAEVYIEQLNELIENWEHPAVDPIPMVSTEAAGGCGEHAADQGAVTTSPPEPAGQPGASQSSENNAPAGEWGQAETERRYEAAMQGATLASLGMMGKLLETLAENGVSTIYDWEHLRQAVTLGRKEWPKGVGPKKRDETDERIGQWCGKNSHRWTSPGSVQASNDRAEEAADQDLTADVAASKPGQPGIQPTSAPSAVSSDIDDL